ncbi:signal peptidase II [Sulfitobacter sp. M220]|jgi:signal peptidase II|uniref:Lipoprotein signal peptidase n=2 Tax=Roseobacteraceae TaxID=2854170 RepID=A0ABY0SXG4_9RHOB|nr:MULTISPECIES: signal peptidase II [Roseobacteraceae]MDG1129005.1 signal peptidase II [Paracoccaceae bacterium]MBQ0802716.1 signal peptidase II [Sulfitobacter litoralis]MCF7779606.1 signal peptidase II [Sulfitobacter sp. M220]UXX85387.1 signal peptidase II [Roseovarius pelagicus]SDP72260.1 signal peptidase II [Sulfitobacter litoralis]|tara:strand:- start:553 stop:1029 length:477 start_codon:yes stop_codon:yes gene_type:complete
MATRSIGICTAVAALAADQASKAFVLANAEALATGVAVFPGFNLIFHRNYGVTFGFFQNVPWWVLALVATAVVLFLVVSLIRATQAAEAVAYGMVIGGALGNIVDRLRFEGVTDFLDFYLGTAHWPAFNLADVFVVCGVGILLIFSGREKVAASETSR